MNLLSFKKIVACFGLLTVASSPTIMVVSTMNENEGTKKDERLVVNAINNKHVTRYGFYVGTKASTVTSSVCAEFIKNQFIDDSGIKSLFNDSLYSTNKIIVSATGKEISDSDFDHEQHIDVTINYNYGGFTNQKTH